MSATPKTDYEHVLTIVRSWSAAQRFTLVQEVLKTLAPSDLSEHPERHTLDQALGLLATRSPAPTDAEIAEWLDERRTERYKL